MDRQEDQGAAGKGVQPSEIIVLVQRKRAARVILNALKAAEVPAKSYYEESQLETDDAQMHFAFQAAAEQKRPCRPALFVRHRFAELRANPYAKVRAHCENTGDTPYDALKKLSAGTLTLPHTKPLIEQFEKIKKVLAELEPIKEDVPKLIEELFPQESRRSPSCASSPCRSLTRRRCRRTFQRDDEGDHAARHPARGEGSPRHELAKSKGLSSPYVFIAQCVQGVLPQIPKPGTPKAERRLR